MGLLSCPNRLNLGSHVVVTSDPTHADDKRVFRGMFISFEALIRGMFASCRPIIGLDGSL